MYPTCGSYIVDLGPVSRKFLSLEMHLSSLITMVTIVFPKLEDIRFFEKLAPGIIKVYAHVSWRGT